MPCQRENVAVLRTQVISTTMINMKNFAPHTHLPWSQHPPWTCRRKPCQRRYLVALRCYRTPATHGHMSTHHTCNAHTMKNTLSKKASHFLRLNNLVADNPKLQHLYIIQHQRVENGCKFSEKKLSLHHRVESKNIFCSYKKPGNSRCYNFVD